MTSRHRPRLVGASVFSSTVTSWLPQLELDSRRTSSICGDSSTDSLCSADLLCMVSSVAGCASCLPNISRHHHACVGSRCNCGGYGASKMFSMKVAKRPKYGRFAACVGKRKICPHARHTDSGPSTPRGRSASGHLGPIPLSLHPRQWALHRVSPCSPGGCCLVTLLRILAFIHLR